MNRWKLKRASAISAIKLCLPTSGQAQMSYLQEVVEN